MKIQILITGLLLLHLSVFSQTKIDDFVSIEFPGEVQIKDFNEANASVKSFYSNSKAESYFVMRMAAIVNGKEHKNLAVDSSQLYRIYKQIYDPQIESMKRKGFLLLDTQKVKFKDYLAYKLSYSTADSQNESAETLLICLNGVVYVFTYSRVSDYILQHKEDFQKSIIIDSSAKQIAETKTNSTKLFSVSNFIAYGIIASFLIFFIRKGRNKSKYGINLKRIYCPVCNTKQPLIRKPVNERQLLWGGCTCSKCNTEMDKYGRALNS
ncbi:hypothetical protein [Pedobacter sp. UBA4863]|uniref:hypothetical protein n=1 Tax=Pedobacter sp. UBA4863 TaxID=1947060 RepID=UPI0025FDAF9C|nr:hypothetical protein [Pedobacter sp. UBA4863]